MGGQIKKWTGSLNTNQTQIITEFVKKMRTRDAEKLEESKKKQGRFLELLRSKSTISHLESQLEILLEVDEPSMQALKEVGPHNAMVDLIVSLYKEADEKQKNFFLGRLASVKQEFIAIQRSAD